MYVITSIYQRYHHIIAIIMTISQYHHLFRLMSPYHLIFRRMSCITRKSHITISPNIFGKYHHFTPKKVQYHQIWGGGLSIKRIWKPQFLVPHGLKSYQIWDLLNSSRKVTSNLSFRMLSYLGRIPPLSITTITTDKISIPRLMKGVSSRETSLLYFCFYYNTKISTVRHIIRLYIFIYVGKGRK